MKRTALILTVILLALVGCDKKSKSNTKTTPPPPPTTDVQQVPDAPSGLELAAIAIAATAAFHRTTRRPG